MDDLKAKDWMMVVGTFLLFVGVMCLPTGKSFSPPGSLSSFDYVTEHGLFFSLGAKLAIAGALMMSVGALLRRR